MIFIYSENSENMAIQEMVFSGEWSDDTSKERFILELDLKGVEAIWEDGAKIRGYINDELVEKIAFNDLANEFGLNLVWQPVQPGKWDVEGSNDQSEVILLDRCRIHTPEYRTDVEYEVELAISEQLSFGSGKHPSTQLCLEYLLKEEINEKYVLDIGTGSGILALMAARLGAARVVAFDNNPWAIGVAKYNQKLNEGGWVEFIEVGVDRFHSTLDFDLFLVNLNKQVFLSEEFLLPLSNLKKDGVVVVSGFMRKDEAAVTKRLEDKGLKPIDEAYREDWRLIVLTLAE